VPIAGGLWRISSSWALACGSVRRGGKRGLAPASGPDLQPLDPPIEEAVDPVADGLRGAGPEQARGGHVLDRSAGGDLEDRRGPLATIGLGVGVADRGELGQEIRGQGNGGRDTHGCILRSGRATWGP
jgi:hypothetical protein